MNNEYLQSQKGLFQLIRLFLLIVSIIYISIFSCGQNSFGGHANVDSTSDSEFIHIIMWVALAIDGFIFLSRLFEQDDGTHETSIFIDLSLGLIYFVAFVILLVSWIKCSNTKTLFCKSKYKCYIHILPAMSSLTLSVLYAYHGIQVSMKSFIFS